MNEQIKTILEELYIIDESFRAHEDKLIKLIAKLLDAKPDTKLDDEFVAKLRRELLSETASQDQARIEKTGVFNLMNLNKFSYAALGAAITLLIVLPSVMLLNRSGGVKETAQLDLSTESKIARLSDNAFGPLSAPGSSPIATDEEAGQGLAALSESEGSAVPEARGIGGGGGSAVAESTEAKMISMPAPDIINYAYQYVGDDITIDEGLLPVYKRAKDDTLARQIAQVAGNIDFGMFDTSLLKNITVGSLQLTEDREYGFMTYFNFQDNSMSLSMNWEKWPQPTADCRDQACYDRYRLQPSDVPTDDKLIAVADGFLKDYKIDRNNYGEPRVNRYWENTLVLYAEGEMRYIPEIIQVVYPYLIEGQVVQDEGGNYSGLSVEVNIRYQRAAGVNGLVVPKYESSDYKSETDGTRLVKVAEQGGLNRLYTNPDAKETITLKLGTPERALVRYWNYNVGQGKGGEELYIPALIFPIENKEEAPNFWRTNVVVPLVAEILENIEEPPVGIPEPMPLLREESAPALPEEDIEVEALEIDG
jgi:hypothetical protein